MQQEKQAAQRGAETRRGSNIYPMQPGGIVGSFGPVFEPSKVQFDAMTNKFTQSAELEELYQVHCVHSEAIPTSNGAWIILALYLCFTLPNVMNLFSDDEEVVKSSETYMLIAFPVIAPIPILLSLLRNPSFQKYMNGIYTVIAILWSISFIAGGMHSMVTEWRTYLQDDVSEFLTFLEFPENKDISYKLSNSDPTCNCSFWIKDGITEGTSHYILRDYLGNILLPAATMNINLLRLILVFVVTPLLKIDTTHYGLVVALVSLSYCILIQYFYPSTNSSQFQINKALLFCFPLAFSFVMFLRQRDYERIVRLDFLHMWSIERAADWANKQKEIIAQENKDLKKELSEQDKLNQSQFDLDSPLSKILTELKEVRSNDGITVDYRLSISNIIRTLTKIDGNLFAPDINAQMKENAGVDKDTKSWAIGVLGNDEYRRQNRSGSTVSEESRQVSSLRLIQSMTDDGTNDKEIYSVGIPLEDNILNKTLEHVRAEGWDVDCLELERLTSSRPLYYVFCALIHYHKFLEKNSITPQIFYNFAFLVDDGYISNPYHSSTHGADVLSSVHYLIFKLSDGAIRKKLTSHEFLAALIASAIHDFRHPGKSNLYLVKTRDPLAIQFSDSSVLERMHLSEAFFLTKDKNCNIFHSFSSKAYRPLRKMIIEMVLSTDLSNHLKMVGNLKTAMYSDSDVALDPLTLLRVCLKCADIGHSAKRLDLHIKWSGLIIEEFFIQGDEERRKGVPISPFMDREAENSAKNQVGFFEFIVLPFYETVAEVVFVNDFDDIVGNVKSNYNLWKAQVEKGHTSIEAIKAEVLATQKEATA